MVGKERERAMAVLPILYLRADRQVLLLWSVITKLLEVLFLPIMCVCDQEIRTQQKYLASVETPGRFLINDEFRNGKSPTIGFTTPRVLQMYGFQYWLE